MKKEKKENNIKIEHTEKKIVTDNFRKCGKCDKYLIDCLC
jgi:hypothetical protein